MIAMIALSWAVSTVISIPPLFGLKDPVISADQLHNFTAPPDAVAGPFNPLLIGESGWNRARDKDQTVARESERVNKTVTLENINCVISQNIGCKLQSAAGTNLIYCLESGIVMLYG